MHALWGELKDAMRLRGVVLVRSINPQTDVAFLVSFFGFGLVNTQMLHF